MNQNVESDSAAASGGQGKYVKYVNFPWPPPEAAPSVFNFSLFLILKKFLRRINKSEISSMSYHKLSEMPVLERSVRLFSRS